MTSTLDQISGGRFELGIGSGWFREEYEAYGYHYPSNAERIDQLEEGIQIIKAMWTEDEPSFHGRYYRIEKAYNFPKPVQQPHPRIMIGGSGRKILAVMARHGDIVEYRAPRDRAAKSTPPNGRASTRPRSRSKVQDAA